MSSTMIYSIAGVILLLVIIGVLVAIFAFGNDDDAQDTGEVPIYAEGAMMQAQSVQQ